MDSCGACQRERYPLKCCRPDIAADGDGLSDIGGGRGEHGMHTGATAVSSRAVAFSIGSLGSVGSMLSGFSRWSILAWRRSGVRQSGVRVYGRVPHVRSGGATAHS